MHQVVAALAGAMTTWLGQLVLRWVSRAGRTETLDRRLKVLALHRRLQQAGIGLEELDRIERKLTGGDRESND